MGEDWDLKPRLWWGHLGMRWNRRGTASRSELTHHVMRSNEQQGCSVQAENDVDPDLVLEERSGRIFLRCDCNERSYNTDVRCQRPARCTRANRKPVAKKPMASTVATTIASKDSKTFMR